MKLFVNRKHFSWTEKFSVLDDKANEKYHVYGELFSWGKKLHIEDENNNEVALLEYGVMSLKPKFTLYVNDIKVCDIVRHFSLFKPKYSLQHTSMSIDGDVWEENYSILDGEKVIANAKKKRTCWGDGYMIYVDKPEYELKALVVALAIWCIVAIETDVVKNDIFDK